MSIPSFSSFPRLEEEESSRKHYSHHEPDSQTKSERRKREKGHSSSKRRDDERHRDSSKERRRDRDRHKKRDKEKYRDKDGKRREDERHGRADDVDESYRLFFSDRRPDHLNLQYGGLHAGDIPKYRMKAGGRFAIGLSRGLVLHRVGKGIEVCLQTRAKKLSGITDSRTRSLLALPPNRRIVPSEESAKYTEVDGFIQISSHRKKSNPEDTYRSITETGNGTSSDSEWNSSRPSSDDESDDQRDEHPETSQQAQIRALEQQLAVNKASVSTWLSLLDVTLSSIPITSKNATRARSDISVSLLERAIDSHSIVKESPTLRIKYLKAGEEIWNEKQLGEKWEQALGLGDVALWVEWFEWRIRTRKGDGIDGIVADLSRLLSSPPFQGESPKAELARLRVFWRTATVTRNAGFSERATAMFQAQLELAFYLPSQLATLPFATQLDELEEYWETECPRILEDGTIDWRHWYQSGKPETVPLPPAISTGTEIRDLDPYRQWALQELSLDRSSLFSTRTTSNEDGDPYSMILFPDIRGALVKVTCPQAKHALRLATLCFFGLPLPGLLQEFSLDEPEHNWDDRWNMKSFLDLNHVASLFPDDSEKKGLIGESIAGATIAQEKEYRDSFGPVKHWGFRSLAPFDILMRGGRARQAFWGPADVQNVDTKVILRTFAQLRQGDNDMEWDALALLFEEAVNVKNALKLSKAFLSVPRDPSILEYWSAHAQLERLNGKFDSARKVYHTVLVGSLRKGKGGVMWWNWAEMEWLADNEKQAMNVVLLSVGIDSASGVSILRAKRALDDLISSSPEWREQQSWIKLRALLELLNGTSMKGVLDIFDDQLSAMAEGSPRHESLTMASLLFVYNYRVVLNSPMPPALLRERAARALEAYPSNSIILGVFLEGEKGQGVWGKVRSLLGASDGKVKDVARRMEEVWVASWEKGRWIGEMERTRSGLAAAVEHERWVPLVFGWFDGRPDADDRTRASPVVWRLYLEFEIRAGEFQNAKRLLFRAIKECPLEKELYLLGFGPLRSVFDGKELRGLADLMVERGIRLRKGVEEDVEMEREREDNGDERMEEDEIEHNARELRRLMPY